MTQTLLDIQLDIPIDRAERDRAKRAEARRLKEHYSRCHCCKIPWGFIFEAPMLTNKTWAKVGKSRHEVLCWACSEARSRERMGRGLRFSDLLPAPVNFGHYGPDYVDFYWGRRTIIPTAWEKIIEIARRMKERADAGNPFDHCENPEDMALADRALAEAKECATIAAVIQRSQRVLPGRRRWQSTQESALLRAREKSQSAAANAPLLMTLAANQTVTSVILARLYRRLHSPAPGRKESFSFLPYPGVASHLAIKP